MGLDLGHWRSLRNLELAWAAVLPLGITALSILPDRWVSL
jgi:hypothetical protein